MMTARLVQLEGQGGRPGSDQGLPPAPDRFRVPLGGSMQQSGPGQSPRELMTGHAHPHWLTLLSLGELQLQRA